jgi:enterochelin esterase family protein
MDHRPSFELHTLRVDSRALVDNPLGDAHVRELPVLAPRNWDRAQPLPTLLLLAGFSGQGVGMLVDDPWSEGLARRLDRLAAEGKIGPLLVALPDCFTRYGGSQYINSEATGRYEDYLWQDVLSALRERFTVGRIGVAGKSSGGYGALVQAMRHPELVSACASHSGDLYFEYCYGQDIPRVARTLRKHGGLDGFFEHFQRAPKKREGATLEAINLIAMAACYAPDRARPHGFALPFDVDTGERDEAVWARWLAHDPVRMIEQPAHQAALAGLKLLHVECGTRDEFFLDWGARIFAARLAALGIAHRHDEFDDGHMGVAYRWDVSLPLLFNALSERA